MPYMQSEIHDKSLVLQSRYICAVYKIFCELYIDDGGTSILHIHLLEVLVRKLAIL